MDTDRFWDALPQEHRLLRRSPWYVLAALLLLVSALTRQPVVFFAAGFALVLGALPELWYRLALRSLAVSHQFDQERVCFGEQVTLSIRIENRKWLPLPWLEVEDEIPAVAELLNGNVSPTYKPERNALVNACSLWSFQRVTRRYHLRCLQRGTYVFGPTILRSTDPFGWLMHEERLETRTILLVYPLFAPLSSLGLPARFLFGERASTQRTLEDPLRIAGVRAYQWGDEPRRINWKASARTGMLQSKLYEPGTQHRLLLLLDSRTFLESWMGIDPDLQELTISVAASLAHAWLEEGYPVGLATNGIHASAHLSGEALPHAPATHLRVPIARGAQQQARILEALAQVIAYFSLPMARIIEQERAALSAGTTVVYVGTIATLQEGTIERLLALRRQGMGVQLVLTGEKDRPLPVETAGLLVHRLGGREVWHELLQTDAASSDGTSTTAFHLD